MTSNGLNGWLGTQETIEPLEKNRSSLTCLGPRISYICCVFCRCITNFAHNVCFVIAAEIHNMGVIMKPLETVRPSQINTAWLDLTCFHCQAFLVSFSFRNTFTVTPGLRWSTTHCVNRDMLLHNLIHQKTVAPWVVRSWMCQKDLHISASHFSSSLSLSLWPCLPTTCQVWCQPAAHRVPQRVYSFCFDTRS